MKNAFIALALFLLPMASIAADLNTFVSQVDATHSPYQVLADAFTRGRPSAVGDFPTLAETSSGDRVMHILQDSVLPETKSADLKASFLDLALLNIEQTSVVGGSPGTPDAGPLFPGTPGVPGTTNISNVYIVTGVYDFNRSQLSDYSDAQFLYMSRLSPATQAKYTMHFLGYKSYCQGDDGTGFATLEYRVFNGMIICKLTPRYGAPQYNYGWIESRD